MSEKIYLAKKKNQQFIKKHGNKSDDEFDAWLWK